MFIQNIFQIDIWFKNWCFRVLYLHKTRRYLNLLWSVVWILYRVLSVAGSSNSSRTVPNSRHNLQKYGKRNKKFRFSVKSHLLVVETTMYYCLVSLESSLKCKRMVFVSCWYVEEIVSYKSFKSKKLLYMLCHEFQQWIHGSKPVKPIHFIITPRYYKNLSSVRTIIRSLCLVCSASLPIFVHLPSIFAYR